jgi:hypothetical protein
VKRASRRTGSQSDSLGIVIFIIVLDPCPVGVVLLNSILVIAQHPSDGTITEEARGEGHLETEPVAVLANVEDVAGVGGAS